MCKITLIRIKGAKRPNDLQNSMQNDTYITGVKRLSDTQNNHQNGTYITGAKRSNDSTNCDKITVPKKQYN